MNRAICLLLLASFAASTAGAATEAEPPGPPGSRAPQIESRARPSVGTEAAALEGQVRWLDGASVPRFEPGRVYVLDLWATWCVSCIARMPHLSALATRHVDEGLTVIGVAVMQEGAAMTPTAFMRMKPGAMTYPVAEELVNNQVPSLYQPPPGGFVPFMLIIDRQGRIAWMSSPRDPFEGFEAALESILSGSWDLAAAVATDARRAELEAAVAPLEAAARDRHEAGDAEGLRTVVGEIIALDASLVGNWATDLYRLIRQTDPVAARTFAAEAVDGGLSRNAPALLDLGRVLVREPDAETRELAVWAARRADEIKHGADPDFVWALARIENEAGDNAAAVVTMERALAAARAIDWDRSVMMMMERELASLHRM